MVDDFWAYEHAQWVMSLIKTCDNVTLWWHRSPNNFKIVEAGVNGLVTSRSLRNWKLWELKTELAGTNYKIDLIG